MINTIDSKEIIPYNQNEIEEEVRKILLNKGMTDILFPGSNTYQLSNIMTYLVYVLNTNTAINLKEVLLPLATKINNIKYGAQNLGYEPRQKISYIYDIKVIVNKNEEYGQNPGEPDYDTTFKVTLPKYTEFKSGSHSYWYVDDDIDFMTSNELIDNGDLSSFNNVYVKEGILSRFKDNDLLSQRTFTVLDENGEVVVKQNYLIPFKDVEQYGLEVFLTYIDEDGINHVREKWEQSEYFLIDDDYTNDRNKYARMQNIFLNNPEIYFEIGGMGNSIRLNTLIEINVLQSSGSNGKVENGFTLSDGTAAQYFSVNGFTEYQKGQNEESGISIKENAPLFNNTANRLVTAKDYVSFTQKHEKVNKTICWGAEDETARDRGYVYLAMTPERTVREFLSIKTNTDDDPTNDNEESVDNTFFQLQNTPGHPYMTTTHGMWHMGNDTDNGTPPTPYPDKNSFEINDTWEITFNDTDSDELLLVHGGDLDGVSVHLGDILYLDDDGSGGKIFTKKDKGFVTKENLEQMTNWFLDPENDIIDLYADKVDTDKILSYLKPFQIMSIKTSFRQPTYCNFNFRVNLVQTTLSSNQAEQNKSVFDVIDKYFEFEVEDFDKIFIMSTLVSKINEYISDINGINIDLNMEMILSPYMYDYRFYRFDNQKIIFSTLALPFDRIYDISSGELDTKMLPKIMGSSNYPLFVDLGSAWTGDGTETPNKTHKVIGCPIHTGNDNTGYIVGYYFIRNDYIKNIEIQLFFSDDGTVKSTPQGDFEYIDLSVYPIDANIKEVDFFYDTGFGYNGLLYPGVDSVSLTDYTKGVNIPFSDYTIPRLNSVEFIKG